MRLVRPFHLLSHLVLLLLTTRCIRRRGCLSEARRLDGRRTCTGAACVCHVLVMRLMGHTHCMQMCWWWRRSTHDRRGGCRLRSPTHDRAKGYARRRDARFDARPCNLCRCRCINESRLCRRERRRGVWLLREARCSASVVGAVVDNVERWSRACVRHWDTLQCRDQYWRRPRRHRHLRLRGGEGGDGGGGGVFGSWPRCAAHGEHGARSACRSERRARERVHESRDIWPALRG